MTGQAAETKRASARRSAILAVAWDSFLKDGYAGTSMSTIAARLGGSKGTLYNYFASKEELLTAVVREKGEEISAQLADIPDAHGDLRQTLTQIGTKLLHIILTDEFLAFYRLGIAEAPRFPEIGTAVYDTARRAALAPLSEYLKSLMRAGRIRVENTLELAEFFFDLCSVSLHRRGLLAVPPAASEKDIRHNVERAVTVFIKEYGRSA